MILSEGLKQEVFERLKGNCLFLIGSFSLALLEDLYFDRKTIIFNDIDILCRSIPKNFCKNDSKYMKLYRYFKEKHDIGLSFNYYSPQLFGCEELIQEASLVNINRFLIDIDKNQIIFDKNMFKYPSDIVQTYYNNEIKINPDCCTYYYTKKEKNIEHLKKYNLLTDENVKLLDKKLRYTSDTRYIRDFYNNQTRYATIPEKIFDTKPKEYFIKYFDIKNKFVKGIVSLE